VLTGDIHCSWVSDLTKNPYDPKKYNLKTGEGSGAVEFVTPSISSANVDELLGVRGRTPFIDQAEGIIKMLNPHIKDLELTNHGYFILDVTPEKAQADYYFVDSIAVPTKTEKFWKGFYSPENSSTVSSVSVPAIAKLNPPDFAPETVQELTLVSKETDENDASNSLLVLGIYPNPLHTYMNIGYVLKVPQIVTVKIYGELGDEIHSALGTNQEPGTYSLLVDTKNIENGKYYCRFITQNGSTTRTFIVNK
ncbi:MAG: alkaline phosphatase D family protein, partial [Ignavibacteriae bacterium]|nr:alkaline phosphatase D family protein [Ignavibacteriota bacterium]